MEEVGLGLSGIAWNRASQFCPRPEWTGMKEVGFGLIGIAWNEGSQEEASMLVNIYE
jgi:hypothetical protein